MPIIQQLNSPVMYLICGSIVAVVAVFCVIFMVRAYKAGVAVGMDEAKMKRTITASASFAVLPSVGILLGVIALSGSLGTPLPWLRLSVIGALHYETQVAEVAAETAGLPGLSATYMTPKAFSTIALLMGFCIIWGMVFSVFFTKKYTERLKTPKEKDGKPGLFAGFGDKAMTAMFIGLVSTYIGNYIGKWVSDGDFLPLAVALVGGAAMAVFIWLREKKNAEWVDSFSIAGSMIIAMASAVLFTQI